MNHSPFGIGDFIASFKGDTPGHPFRGNQWEGGSGGVGKVLSSPDDIANKLADQFGETYGFDATHTREGFIKNKRKQLKENAASPEFAERASKSIGSTIKDGAIGDDVTYIVLKKGESGYEAGQYDKAMKSITLYENEISKGNTGVLGDTSNISSTYDDPIRGTAIHEYGHHYAESLKPDVEMRARVKLEGATTDEKRYIKKSISYYASTSPIELAAEAYAMSKHPDFEKQPEEVKQFIQGVLGD